MKIGDLCTYAPKSAIKAGESVTDGAYMFFTSSADENKRYSDYQLDCEGIIMGTGGNATLHYYNGKFATSTDCVVLLPTDTVRCKYLYYFFLCNIAVLENGFKGAGLKHTNKNYINSIELTAIPSLEEQDKVISVLDNVQAVIDKRKNEISKLDDLIKAQFVEMFGDPVENSKGFELVPLGDLGILKRGTSKHRPRNDAILLGGKYPLIQTGDVSNAKDYITEYTSTYSEIGLKQSKMWNKGTLCITIAANIAETAILSFDACFPDSVVGFIPGEKVTTLFVHNWFKFLQPILEENAPAVAQKNLNVATLEKTDVIVPPIELQNEYETFIKQIDKSKALVQQALDKAQLLFDSLMQQYFG